LPALYSRPGGRLLTISCVGEAHDPATVMFHTRAGLLVRHGFQ
jgi:hypothetical protein